MRGPEKGGRGQRENGFESLVSDAEDSTKVQRPGISHQNSVVEAGVPFGWLESGGKRSASIPHPTSHMRLALVPLLQLVNRFSWSLVQFSVAFSAKLFLDWQRRGDWRSFDALSSSHFDE